MIKGQDKERKKIVSPYPKPGVGKCFRCNQPGHHSNECHTRRVVNIVKRKNEEDDEDIHCEVDGKDVNDYEEEYGQIFVIQRMMLTPKQEDQTQRHKLFRNRCTINGKVFDLIVVVVAVRK